MEIKLPAQPDEFALGKPILLENLGDHLKVPASRQINRIFVPALECLFFFEICRVVDVLVESVVSPMATIRRLSSARTRLPLQYIFLASPND